MNRQVIQVTGPMTIVLTTNMEVIRGESPGITPADAIATAAIPAALKVRTLGGFQAWVERAEVGSVLDGRRVQRFIWLYLLVRELLRPANRISRPALMDELYPGIDPEQQRLRLRQQLFSMSHRLPKPMATCVTAQGESIQFDASGCDIDARRILDLAKAVRGQPLPLPDATLAEIEAALVDAGEEFIPEWEDIEELGTGGRGTAGTVVAELRGRLEACHLSLLEALADSCRDNGQLTRAIPYLKQGLSRFTTDEDIALRLIEAYERTGRPKTAARLKEHCGLPKAS